MAKIELRNKLNMKAPSVVLIPGGPGLGSDSFEALARCLKDINVYLYHPTGTLDGASNDTSSYESQIQDLSKEINKLGPVYLCGHSFGGIQAVDVTLRIPALIEGLICIASPFSETAFSEVSNNYNQGKTSEQISMDEVFNDNPTNENYKKWFASYAHIYFSETNLEVGRKLLLEGKVNVKNFLEAIEESSQKGFLLNEIRLSKVKKLFISGCQDKLLPPQILERESSLGHFVFKSVDNAGHFIHFEQPEKTAKIIEEFILNEEGEL